MEAPLCPRGTPAMAAPSRKMAARVELPPPTRGPGGAAASLPAPEAVFRPDGAGKASELLNVGKTCRASHGVAAGLGQWLSSCIRHWRGHASSAVSSSGPLSSEKHENTYQQHQIDKVPALFALPREAGDVLSLELSKAMLDGALSSLVYWEL